MPLMSFISPTSSRRAANLPQKPVVGSPCPPGQAQCDTSQLLDNTAGGCRISYNSRSAPSCFTGVACTAPYITGCTTGFDVCNHGSGKRRCDKCKEKEFLVSGYVSDSNDDNDACPADEGVPGRGGVTRDVTRFPQSRQNVIRHRAEERRPRLELRFQHRAERIEVVARDERPGPRQRVHELAVAVIDDVEQVEPVT